MCNYHCPYAERRACAGFLLCKSLYLEGVNYNDRKNAMTVICAHQKQCMRTGQMENTDEARVCYESKRAVVIEPPIAETPKAAPKASKKKSN